VNENESVQEQSKASAKDKSFSLVALAAEHGYEFTSEEAQTAWDAAQARSCPTSRWKCSAAGVARRDGRRFRLLANVHVRTLNSAAQPLTNRAELSQGTMLLHRCCRTEIPLCNISLNLKLP